MSHRHHSFAPHMDADTRLIILGSLPGAESLAKQQYYGNSQNNFWKLLESIFSVPFVSLDYAARLEALTDLHIGLWDVIESAARKGSLDVSIKQPEAQDLWSIFRRCPRVEALAFNGGKAANLGRRILGEKGDLLRLPAQSDGPPFVHLLDLPSSSAANTRTFATKCESWAKLAPYAGSG